MTSVLFVHGTGVREPAYTETFTWVRETLLQQAPGLTVAPCSWGEVIGVKLHADGASVPDYALTRTLEGAGEDDDVALWARLYTDPLAELRTRAFAWGDGAVAGSLPPSAAEMDARLRGLTPSADLAAALTEGGIADVFPDARDAVAGDESYQAALAGVGDEPARLDRLRRAVAQAVVAQAMADKERQGTFAPILTDAAWRDEVVGLVGQALGGAGDDEEDRSLGGWVAGRVFDLVVALGDVAHIERKRGAITDAAYPGAGDVARYLSRGAPVRDFIRARLLGLPAPVVIVAHSLGGVASVDLLAQEALPQVRLLVTVGSQAPFLYEIDALPSLRYGEPLPPTFPAWLNIYDPRDFLSYIGAGVFGDRVVDVEVDNRQPFPRSHSAYWTNPATWQAILAHLP